MQLEAVGPPVQAERCRSPVDNTVGLLKAASLNTKKSFGLKPGVRPDVFRQGQLLENDAPVKSCTSATLWL